MYNINVIYYVHILYNITKIKNEVKERKMKGLRLLKKNIFSPVVSQNMYNKSISFEVKA